MNNSLTKKFSPNKKYYAELDGALLNVVNAQNDSEQFGLLLPEYDLRKPDIFRWSSDSKAIGMLICQGILEEGTNISQTNYWVGIWYPLDDNFFTVHFPDRKQLELNYETVDSIKVLADERTVICSVKGVELLKVEMPNEKMLTVWQKENQTLEGITTNKKEWTWNHNSEGYDGVSLYTNEVLWFSHAHNPHAGGIAYGQSFEDFLQNGPYCFIPKEFLPELFAEVKKLVS